MHMIKKLLLKIFVLMNKVLASFGLHLAYHPQSTEIKKN